MLIVSDFDHLSSYVHPGLMSFRKQHLDNPGPVFSGTRDLERCSNGCFLSKSTKILPSFVGSYLGSTVSDSDHLSSYVHQQTHKRSIDSNLAPSHLCMLANSIVKDQKHFEKRGNFPFFSTNSREGAFGFFSAG